MPFAFPTLNLPLSFVILVTLICNCTSDRAETAGKAASVDAVSAAPVEASDTTPAMFLEAQHQLIPVYEKFAGVAPFFERPGDTTYVINFWATWCKPCVEELPLFERLRQEYAGEKMRIILISLDFERDLKTKFVAFVNQHRLKPDVMVLLDGNYNTWIDQVDPDWGGDIPVTLVYNRQRRRFYGEQFASYEELAALLRDML